MAEQRLVNLALERDIAQLNTDAVIDKFAFSDRNRRITLVYIIIINFVYLDPCPN